MGFGDIFKNRDRQEKLLGRTQEVIGRVDEALNVQVEEPEAVKKDDGVERGQQEILKERAGVIIQIIEILKHGYKGQGKINKELKSFEKALRQIVGGQNYENADQVMDEMAERLGELQGQVESRSVQEGVEESPKVESGIVDELQRLKDLLAAEKALNTELEKELGFTGEELTDLT